MRLSKSASLRSSNERPLPAPYIDLRPTTERLAANAKRVIGTSHSDGRQQGFPRPDFEKPY